MNIMDSSRIPTSCPFPRVWVLVLSLVIIFWTGSCSTFLLEDPPEPCPNPASNCLQETFNRVLPSLGCLGCQTGCKPGYIMTANPNHFIKTTNFTQYDYNGITIPSDRNVSEPQWLCEKGDSCQWGYYTDKMGANDICSLCGGSGCLKCSSYEHCQQCVPGYRLHRFQTGGRTLTVCTSSGVLCPNQPPSCRYESYVVKYVGCLGCIDCEEGYLPSANPDYHRHGDNVTSGNYVFQGMSIIGSVEINEPRYICQKGDDCLPGWHNLTRGGILTCELD